MTEDLSKVRMVFGQQYELISRRCASTLPLQIDQLQFDTSVDHPDWLVVTEPNRSALETVVPYERRMLMVGEPSPLSYWPTEYINQFGVLLSPYSIAGYRGHWVQSHPGLPWFVGWNRRTQTVMDLQTLEHLPVPQKRNAVSVVVSRKVVHAGHRNRLKFLERLGSRIGDRLQIFGRGIRDVDDKLDAILPYRYHLALENTSEPYYWTEKLSDAFLGYALPLYSGCPNIGQWFGDDSIMKLDLTDHGRSIEQVERLLDQDAYASYVPGITEARRKILTDENLYSVVARAIQGCNAGTAAAEISTIHPLSKPSLLNRLQRETHRVYRQMTTGVPKAA